MNTKSLEKTHKKDYGIKEEENEELIVRTEIEDTPFVVIELKESGEYFATLGEYRITEKVKSKAIAIESVKKMTWNRVIQVVMILIEKLNKK